MSRQLFIICFYFNEIVTEVFAVQSYGKRSGMLQCLHRSEEWLKNNTALNGKPFLACTSGSILVDRIIFSLLSFLDCFTFLLNNQGEKSVSQE